MDPAAKFMTNPYPFYRRLRARDPVHWDGSSWLLTRYVDVLPALRDARLSSRQFDHPARTQGNPVAAEVAGHLARWMLYSDPPHHSRLRTLVNRAFTPRVIDRLRPRIQQLVDDLLDTAQEQGQFDLIRALAYPLPAMVIAELLGIPPADHAVFKGWTEDLFAFIGNASTPEQTQRAYASLTALTAYFAPVLDRCRRAPTNDLLSQLITAQAHAEHLHDAELVAFCTLLLIAGHETSTNLIGNGVLALLRHPEQAQLLRTEPELIGSAVEEILRYDGPVHLAWRQATTALEIGGQTIGPGQVVLLNLAAANHDPAQFAAPDVFDITRQENRHVAFGAGAHVCLGAPLARLEGQIAIQTLLCRFPNLALTNGTLAWHANVAFRGLAALPVTI